MITLMTVYDKIAERFTPPLVFASVGEGVRTFADAINGKDAKMSSHPEDFALFEIGRFVEETAELTVLQGGARRVTTGLDVKKQ